MNAALVVGICLSLVFAVICFIASNSWIASLLVLLMSILYFVLVVSKRFERYKHKLNLYRECYHFINNFIVSLSIKGSIVSSLENATLGGSEDFKDQMESIEKLNENEKLVYLKKYFPFKTYQLFVDVVFMWLEEGGDVLNMTSYLSDLLRIEEEYVSYSDSESKKKLIEFSILWIFTLAILVALRFALSQFFELISKQVFFSIGIVILFVFLLGSIELLTRKMTEIEIKGWNDERK